MLALIVLLGAVLAGFGFCLGSFLFNASALKTAQGIRTWAKKRKERRYRETFKQMGLELAISQAQAQEFARQQNLKIQDPARLLNPIESDGAPDETGNDEETVSIDVMDWTETASNTKKGDN